MPPPNMADTDECAQRACLRMADVTVMHSVTTRATGSMATAVAILALLPRPPCSSPVLLRDPGRLAPLRIVLLLLLLLLLLFICRSAFQFQIVLLLSAWSFETLTGSSSLC